MSEASDQAETCQEESSAKSLLMEYDPYRRLVTAFIWDKYRLEISSEVVAS